MRRVLGSIVYLEWLLEGIFDLANATVTAWSGTGHFWPRNIWKVGMVSISWISCPWQQLGDDVRRIQATDPESGSKQMLFWWG